MTDSLRNTDRPLGPEFLGALIDRHAAALELYASKWCNCPDDVVQEVLIQLAEHGQRPENTVAWLYGAVRYRAMNAGRAHRRRRHHEAQAGRGRPVFLLAPPGETLEAKEVAAAVDSLPVEEHEVVVARLWGQLSFREIGDVTGSSESTAHRRYETALVRLREKVSSKCENPNEKTS